MGQCLIESDVEYFDLCILSLGDDGHMAGHFLNSQLSNDGLFCKTDDAPISPRGFSINFLLKSKKVIIVAMDESKKAALNSMLSEKTFLTLRLLKI